MGLEPAWCLMGGWGQRSEVPPLGRGSVRAAAERGWQRGLSFPVGAGADRSHELDVSA